MGSLIGYESIKGRPIVCFSRAPRFGKRAETSKWPSYTQSVSPFVFEGIRVTVPDLFKSAYSSQEFDRSNVQSARPPTRLGKETFFLLFFFFFPPNALQITQLETSLTPQCFPTTAYGSEKGREMRKRREPTTVPSSPWRETRPPRRRMLTRPTDLAPQGRNDETHAATEEEAFNRGRCAFCCVFACSLLFLFNFFLSCDAAIRVRCRVRRLCCHVAEQRNNNNKKKKS